MNPEFTAILNRVNDISAHVFDETIQTGNFKKIGDFGTKRVIAFLSEYLKSKKPRYAVQVAQILGSPGSGKSYLAELVLPHLSRSITLSTDQYNYGTREDRKKIIVKGGTPLDEKDFALLASHVRELHHLSSYETMVLPGPYDVQSGAALVRGLTREVTGSFKNILIEGNFYVGKGGASDIELDSLIYLHLNDVDRLHVRLIRDLTQGQTRAKDAEEVFDQFVSRQATQETPYTLPFMASSDVILHATPKFMKDSIKNFSYAVYRKIK